MRLFSHRELPEDPAARFRALFAARPRWRLGASVWGPRAAWQRVHFVCKTLNMEGQHGVGWGGGVEGQLADIAILRNIAHIGGHR